MPVRSIRQSDVGRSCKMQFQGITVSGLVESIETKTFGSKIDRVAKLKLENGTVMLVRAAEVED